MNTITRVATQTLWFVALLVSASTTQALLIENSYGFNIADVSIVSGPATVATFQQNRSKQVFEDDGFDSTLGTLKSVNVTFSSVYFLQGGMQVNDPDAPCPFLLTSLVCEDDVNGGGYFVNKVGFDLYTSASPYLQATESSGTSVDASCWALNGSCTNIVPIQASGFSGTLYEVSDAASLDAFIDNQVQIDVFNWVTAGISYCLDDEDLCTAVAESDFAGAFTIAYTYDAPIPLPVPEPGSFALLGLGLAGLRIARLRREAALQPVAASEVI